MAILAVTGMEAEARIARRAGMAAIVIGGDVAARLTAVERAIALGATGLVSFGIAGALDPTLVPGTVLLSEAVILPDGEALPCSSWPALGGPSPNILGRQKNENSWMIQSSRAVAGRIFGASEIVFDTGIKHSLFDSTGAIAVDLESGAVAKGAARTKIPFIVLRVIADPAARELPPAAQVGLDKQGRPALGPVLASVLKQPGQVPALIRLALDTQTALRALARAASATSFANPPI